jgi:hypothetical protein
MELRCSLKEPEIQTYSKRGGSKTQRSKRRKLKFEEAKKKTLQHI